MLMHPRGWSQAPWIKGRLLYVSLTAAVTVHFLKLRGARAAGLKEDALGIRGLLLSVN